MADIDFFAQVAQQSYSDSREEMMSIDPPVIPERYFRESRERVKPIKINSYEENLEEFNKELKELREKYRKFMVNLSPEGSIHRRRWYQDKFQFRYETEADKADFNNVISGQGEWEQLIIPDYRGPVGRWTGFYRREFTIKDKINEGKKVFLHFEGVDYIANVYLNNRFVGSHEGFFAPFEFDVTDYLNYGGNNILIVEIKNDATTKGIDDCGIKIDGDKIYAATGIGWDDPQLGWHHCPPGAGIYNKVYLEERSELFIEDIFTRPDIDKGYIEAWVDIYNTEFKNTELEVRLSVYPRNFVGEAMIDIPCKAEPAGPGINNYRFGLPFENFRLWSPEEPWLYTMRVSIYVDGKLIDQLDRPFGMRKFHMDEKGENGGLKGSLFLNNKPVILRGANDMGHLQLCVIREDYDQLIDDILIAKIANMNFYRFTQRPVQREIYEYCDMLGMMNQTDMPLFGFLRRNQFTEAVKQAGEMEKLIRSHPSAIMISYINEPSNMNKPSNKKRSHRDLIRSELEDFFECATKVVLMHNPDRVIKNVDGDYDPPTRTGLSDFHCYCMWYTNNGMPIGKLHKGYLPPLKKGWKTGCGEYGAEGLDPVEIMMEDYPKEWVANDPDNELWSPRKIVKAQTFQMHGDWYEEQYNMRDWIKASQEYQAEATAFMTDAYRRRADYITSTAIHLLIDAWPAGWMKTLVDYRRKPKRAFFSYKKSLEPVRINLRTDRFTMYAGEETEAEAWILNDTSEKYDNCRIIATVRTDKEDIQSFEIDASVKPATAVCEGIIKFKAPDVNGRELFYIDAALVDGDNNILNQERLTLEAFERVQPDKGVKVLALGEKANKYLNILGAELTDNMEEAEAVIADESCNLDAYIEKFKEMAQKGVNIVIMTGNNKESIKWDDVEITFKGAVDLYTGGLTYVARNPEEPVTSEFKTRDFYMWYNENSGYIDFIADKSMVCESLKPLLFTYKKPRSYEKQSDIKTKVPIVGYLPYGKGRVVFSSLNIEGFIGKNPILDRFLIRLINK